MSLLIIFQAWFLCFYCLPFIIFILLRQPFNRITIDSVGARERGLMRNTLVAGESMPLVSLVRIDRHGRKTITEEQVDDYFARSGVFISVKNFSLGKYGNRNDSVQREILFEYRPEAWKYLNEKYQEVLAHKKA